MQLLLILIILSNFFNKILCDHPICVSYYDKVNRALDMTKCNIPKYNTRLMLECQLIQSYHNIIRAELSVLDKDNEWNKHLNKTIFKWDSIEDNSNGTPKKIMDIPFFSTYYIDSDLNAQQLKYNVTVSMNWNNYTNISSADLLIYNLNEVSFNTS